MPDNFTLLDYPLLGNDTVLPNAHPLFDILAVILWWYVVVMAVVGVALNTAAVLYLSTKKTRDGHCVTRPCLLCISLGDSFFLATVLVSLCSTHFHWPISDANLCKSMVFATNTAALFTNWCWVSLWGGRYLAVFHPWLYFRFYKHANHYCNLACLFVASVVAECWTLAYATDSHGRCVLDETRAEYGTFKYVLLGESVVSFFVPFVLIMAANVGVLWKTYANHKSALLTQVVVGDLAGGAHAPKHETVPAGAALDQARIISHDYVRRVTRVKRKTIRRFFLLATVDLLLNFPNYILQLSETFTRDAFNDADQYYTDSSTGAHVTKYVITVVSYVFFYSQYAFNVVYVYYLYKVVNGKAGTNTRNNSSRESVRRLQTEKVTRGRFGITRLKKEDQDGIQTQRFLLKGHRDNGD